MGEENFSVRINLVGSKQFENVGEKVENFFFLWIFENLGKKD